MLCVLKEASRENDDNANEIRVAQDMLCVLKEANGNRDDKAREFRGQTGRRYRERDQRNTVREKQGSARIGKSLTAPTV